MSNRVRAFAVAAAIALLLGSGGIGANRAAAEFDVSVDSVEALSGLTAVVAHSDDGVNFRAEPGQDSEILDTLPDGTVVTLRIDEVDTVFGDDDTRWWPVRFDGVDGWVAGFYLDDAGGASTSDSSSSSSSSDTPSFSNGEYAAASTDDGTGLNIRSGAATDFEKVGSVADGDVVQVMGGPDYDGDGNGWYLITDGDVTGFAFAGFLSAASQPDAPASDASHGEAAFHRYDYIAPADGDGVNVRESGSVDAAVVGAVSGSASVRVVSNAVWDDEGDAWYKIDNGDVRGYVLGSLFVASDAPAEDTSSAQAAPATSGPTGTFIYPLSSYVFTQAYGCTGYDFEPWDANIGCNFHNGVDLAAPAYTPIMASDGGTVIAAGWCDCGLGYYVEIDHGNGFSTVYGHQAEQPYVSVGQQVNQGDVIGPVGSTGASTGPHVHFMIKLNGSTVDPLQYLG